jgi:protease PrsW
MNSILLVAMAILPGILICVWIYWQDKFEKESLPSLLICFAWGAVSTVPAIIAQSYFKGWEDPENMLNMAIYSFLIVALTEELSKFLFLRLYAYPKDEFNEPMDGIVYAVMVGMGFATLENIFYVLSEDSGGVRVAIGRAVTAVPAHAAFAVIMGAYIGLAKFIPEQRNSYMFTGIGLAVFFHGLYDFFLLQKSYEFLTILSIIVLVVVINIARRLIKIEQALSPFNPDNQAVIADNTHDASGKVVDSIENETPKQDDTNKDNLV